MKKKNEFSKDNGALLVRFRKENETFDDLVSERDKILRVVEINSITMSALKAELTIWDDCVYKEFKKLYDEKFKISKKFKKEKHG